MTKSGTQTKNMCYNFYYSFTHGTSYIQWNKKSIWLKPQTLCWISTIRLYTFKSFHSKNIQYRCEAKVFSFYHSTYTFTLNQLLFSTIYKSIYFNNTDTIFTFYNNLFVLRTSCSALCKYKYIKYLRLFICIAVTKGIPVFFLF